MKECDNKTNSSDMTETTTLNHGCEALSVSTAEPSIPILRVSLLLRLLTKLVLPRKLRHHSSRLESRRLRSQRIILVARLRCCIRILSESSRLHLLEDVGCVKLLLLILSCLLLLHLLLRSKSKAGLLSHELLRILAKVVVARLLRLLHTRKPVCCMLICPPAKGEPFMPPPMPPLTKPLPLPKPVGCMLIPPI